MRLHQSEMQQSGAISIILKCHWSINPLFYNVSTRSLGPSDKFLSIIRQRIFSFLVSNVGFCRLKGVVNGSVPVKGC